MPTKTVWKRRALLAGGALAVAAWVKGVPYLANFGASDFEFDEIAGLAPFRRLRGAGGATLGGSVFAGLDAPGEAAAPDAEMEAIREAVRADPCAAFFGDARGGPVPVAMFSDFSCPVCRVMDDRIADLEGRDPGSFHIVRHQLPILGVGSVTASRAVLAAEMQGAYRPMHARLIRTPAIANPALIRAIAEDLGLDADRLIADMASPAIDRRMKTSAAIADVFGFVGTPAFAVGRTVFMGSLPEPAIRRLIAQEADGPCASA